MLFICKHIVSVQSCTYITRSTSDQKLLTHTSANLDHKHVFHLSFSRTFILHAMKGSAGGFQGGGFQKSHEKASRKCVRHENAVCRWPCWTCEADSGMLRGRCYSIWDLRKCSISATWLALLVGRCLRLEMGLVGVKC